MSPTSSHFQPLQVENCGRNSRLVVDEDDNGKFRLERVNTWISQQTRDVHTMLDYCWADVAGGGATLDRHWGNVSFYWNDRLSVYWLPQIRDIEPMLAKCWAGIKTTEGRHILSPLSKHCVTISWQEEARSRDYCPTLIESFHMHTVREAACRDIAMIVHKAT